MAPREPKGWGRAALGGILMALGGTLFGLGRSGAEAAARSPGRGQGKGRGARRERAAESRPTSKVRTKPHPREAPPRTRYWPPPPPKPIADAAEEAGRDSRPVDAQSVKLGYERGDVKPGRVVAVMLVSVGVIVAAIAGLFALIGAVHRGDAASGPMTAQQRAVIVAPGPHLQDHPLHDIAMERQRESDLLQRYAWADPQHRTARIPIARAEALVVGHPLDPVPGEASASPAPAAPAPQP